MKTKKTLSERLTNRYLLIIRNEENFAHKISYSYTYAKVIVFITLLLIVLFSLSFYLSSTLLARWFNPVTKEVEINKKLIELSMTVDSLSEALTQKDIFLASLDGVIKEDKKFLRADSARQSSPSTTSRPVDAEQLSESDAALRAEFEDKDPTPPVTIANKGKSSIKDIILLPPLRKGIISAKYNAKMSHYGLDIVAKKDEPIKCVADGIVIFSSYTSDTGYVLAIQHTNNLISFYKHNSVLLKKMGEQVKAGERIAIIGNTGALTTGPHLHFELWYNGTALNPESFITF